MLQFIVDLCNHSYEDECWKEVDTMYWVLSKIDMNKLMNRVWSAMEEPTKTTKVVLCEYNYTTKKSVEDGHPNLVDRLPNGVLVHDAMYRADFVTLMNKAFCLNDNIVWYRRRKITREGLNDIHRMQVVLMFKENAFPEKSVASTTTDTDMPALIPCPSFEVNRWANPSGGFTWTNGQGDVIPEETALNMISQVACHCRDDEDV
jgi:hypothetical protein